MKFNKDYKEFLNHLEKSNQEAQIKTELSKSERSAILLFVAYLNIRYQETPCKTCGGKGQIPCPDGWAICRDCR